jgi:hypothetical protein
MFFLLYSDDSSVFAFTLMITYSVPTSLVSNTCDYGTVLHLGHRQKLGWTPHPCTNGRMTSPRVDLYWTWTKYKCRLPGYEN